MSSSKAPGADQAPPLNWRKYLKIHPACDEYPLLRESDPAAFRALVEDIRANGMHMQVTFWADGHGGDLLLIDGRNRLDALAELGVLSVESKDVYNDEDRLVFVKEFDGIAWAPVDDKFQRRRVAQWSEKVSGDPYALAASYNAHRRMLTPEQKRERIEAAIKRNPDKSLRAIGEETGTDKNTVGAVKTKMVATGEVHQLKKTIGRDGIARNPPAKKTKINIEELSERAERLGFRIERCGRGAFKLFRGEGSGPLLWTNAGGISSHLDGVKAPKDTPAENVPVQTDDPQKAKHAAAEAKAEPATKASAADDGDEAETEADKFRDEHICQTHPLLKNLLALETWIPADINIVAMAMLVREDEDELRRVRRFLDFARRLGEALDVSTGPDDTPPGPGPAPDGETEDEEPGGVEDTAVVLKNVLGSIGDARAVAEAYRKILKVSPFDRGAKKQISDATDSLIRKWRSVQSALKVDPPPSGPGGEPEPKVEEPASAGVPANAADAVEQFNAAVDKLVASNKARGGGSEPKVEAPAETTSEPTETSNEPADAEQLTDRDCDLINTRLEEMFVADDDGIIRLRKLYPGGNPSPTTSADIKEARSLAYGLGLLLEEREGVFALCDEEDEDWTRRFCDLLTACVYLVVIRDGVRGKADTNDTPPAPDERPTTEPPAQTVTAPEPSATAVVDAVVAPEQPIDHSLDIPTCLLRTAEAAAPDAPVPLTPPAPAPAPSPIDRPTWPRVRTTYVFQSPDDPSWREFSDAELEAHKRSAERYCKRFTHYPEGLERARKHLEDVQGLLDIRQREKRTVAAGSSAVH